MKSRYGRLSVIGSAYRLKRHYYVECLCDCGTRRAFSVHHLKSGASRSCGCLIVDTSRTHGATGTPTYTSWEQMHQRCYNKNNKAYRNYGWRGIAVCERWRGPSGFANFLADMGTRPEGKSIDRYPNKNGNYEPSNCRWATRTEQNRNSRKNKFLTWKGETLTQSAWAERLGIGPKTIEGRLSRGWSVDRTLSEPIDPIQGGWSIRKRS